MKIQNRLHNPEAFRAILENYHPSDESIQVLHDTPLVLLVGPTAAGRNTLIGLLVATGRYYMLVSDTTRKPRIVHGKEEKNGEVYWFKDEAEVLAGLENGHYLEAAILHGQQVSGTNISEIHAAHESGKIVLKEIDIAGSETYRKLKNEALGIFLLPPTFEVWMQRLRDRSEMDEEEVRRRLKSAIDEITTARQTDFYHFVINNEIHEAAMAVDELANGRMPDPEKQRLGCDHAEQLLIDIKLYLAS